MKGKPIRPIQMIISVLKAVLARLEEGETLRRGHRKKGGPRSYGDDIFSSETWPSIPGEW